jgi:hypothetical protein
VLVGNYTQLVTLIITPTEPALDDRNFSLIWLIVVLHGFFFSGTVLYWIGKIIKHTPLGETARSRHTRIFQFDILILVHLYEFLMNIRNETAYIANSYTSHG